MAITPTQARRTSTPGNSPVAGSLQPGEFAVEMNVPTRLWVGVPLADDPNQQKLLIDTSVAGGTTYTFGVGINETTPGVVDLIAATTTELGGLLEAPSDGLSYARNNAAWALLPAGTLVEPVGPGTWGRLQTGVWERTVATAGDTMTGALTMNTAPILIQNESLALRATALTRQILGQDGVAGANRWALALGDSSLETGTNTGSDFALGRYDDAGVSLGTALTISRATGAAKLMNNLTIAPPLGWPTLYLQKPPGIGSSAGVFSEAGPGLYRWGLDLGDSVPESGLNAGSNFQLMRFDDAGVFLGTAIGINRATGIVDFQLPPTVGGVALPYVLKTGDTMTGSLNINTSWASLNISRPAGENAQVAGQTNGILRWVNVIADNTAETGANAGSNWMLFRCDDFGTLIDAPITVTRSTGVVNFSQYPTIGGVALPYVLKSGDTMTGSLTTPGLTVATPTGYSTIIINNLAAAPSSASILAQAYGVSRWQLSLDDSFGLQRFDDAGNWIGTALYISRQTADATFSGQVYGNQLHAANGVFAAESVRGVGQFGLIATASVCVLAFATGWGFNWETATGDLVWATAGAADLFRIVATGNVRLQGSANHSFTPVGASAFNFRWDGVYAYIRVDNAAEIGITPVSDERMKQDIAPSTFDCMAAIRATQLYEYRWKTWDPTVEAEPRAAAADAPVVPVGFVAQRQHEVFPDSVRVGEEFGAGVFGATRLWQMQPDVMMAALAGAIKELDARLTAGGL